MTPFEDQTLPFKEGDELPRPEDGDFIIVAWDVRQDHDLPRKVQVFATFGSLAEDWGIFGESAWSQWDVNEQNGVKGKWYAMVEYEEGSCAVASYEVESICGP